MLYVDIGALDRVMCEYANEVVRLQFQCNRIPAENEHNGTENLFFRFFTILVKFRGIFYPSFWGYLKKRISRDFEGFCWFFFEGFRGVFGILGDSFVFFGGGL